MVCGSVCSSFSLRKMWGVEASLLEVFRELIMESCIRNLQEEDRDK